MSEDKTNKVRGRLKLSNLKLNTLLEITDAINNNYSRDQLYAILKNVLLEELHIGKFTLFIFDTRWHNALSHGVSESIQENININEVVDNFDHIDVLNSVSDKNLKYFDIVIPVFHKTKPLAYLLLADLDGEKIEISPIIKHLRFIQTLANIIVVALENKRLNAEYIKQVEVKKEMELAQKMQELLFPKELPSKGALSVESYYKPHKEVGGDYFDVIEIDENKTALCIADVSGKGFSAALLMANFQANLRTLLKSGSCLEDMIKEANKKVIESANYEKFITLFVAIYDSKKRQLFYLNAGHQAGLLIQKDAVKQLKKGCTVLGMFDTLPAIDSGVVTLEKEDKLLCFTDGLTELEKSGEELGVEGIIEIVNEKMTLNNLIENIRLELNSIKESSYIEDDITLLAAEFH